MLNSTNCFSSLIRIGIWSFIAFAVAWSLGTVLYIFVPIPFIGGILNAFFTSLIITYAFLDVVGITKNTISFKRALLIIIFFILFWTSFSIYSTFTTTMGPPGFYKPILGIIFGIIWGIMFLLFDIFSKKFKDKFDILYGLAAGLSSSLVTLIFAFFLKILFDKDLILILSILSVIYFILAGLGAYYASKIFRKFHEIPD